MDARSIGHEFVRQYYELLHSEPGQLHRFYLDGSVYVHASDSQSEEPVIGQQAIFDYISRLNFSDCRTRVRQVDAQESLNKTFVVQVVGELSNAGQPMRPFVQTFILAQSAENKFFVSNDMFRYQDHIVAPEEPVINMPVVVSPAPTPIPLTNAAVNDYYSKPDNHAHINGDVTVLDGLPEPEIAAPVEEPVHQPEPAEPQVIPEPEPEPIVEAASSPEIKQETKAFSWATVAGANQSSTGKKTTPAVSAVVRAPEQVKPTALPAVSAQQSNPKPQRRGNGTASGNGAPAASRPAPSSRANGGVPDNQQIFVGSLNPSMTEEEIKGVFTDFGTAIDIRMTTKQFCFVTFESSQIVDSILAHAKEHGFYCREQRLNVEEKKDRSSSSRVSNGRQSAGGPSGSRGGRVPGAGYGRAPVTAGNRTGRDPAPGRR